MLADVRVLSQADFDAWVAEATTAPVYADLSPEERGAIWYSSGQGFGCEGCHSLDGAAGAGPTWLGLYLREEPLDDDTTVTADDAFIRDSIVDPNAQITEGFFANIMPQDFETRFAEQEAEILAQEGVEINIIEDLIAFIQTLEE